MANSFTVEGRLGNDAEQKHTANGDSIVSFNLASKTGYGDKAITSWLRCSLFGKRGESVLPYLKKGQHVMVIGEFTARPWKDKQGIDKLSNEIRVNELALLGGKEAPKEQPVSSAPPF